MGTAIIVAISLGMPIYFKMAMRKIDKENPLDDHEEKISK